MFHVLYKHLFCSPEAVKRKQESWSLDDVCATVALRELAANEEMFPARYYTVRVHSHVVKAH